MIKINKSILCFFIVLSMYLFPLFSLGKSDQQNVLQVLQNEGFYDNYLYTGNDVLYPDLFISKYEFVQSRSDGFSIINCKDWKEARRITNSEWLDKHFHFYSVNNDNLYFSIESPCLFTLYEYSLSENNYSILFEKTTDNIYGNIVHDFVRYSVFDANQGKLFLCEYGTPDTVQIYNILEEGLAVEIPISVQSVIACSFGNPMQILCYEDIVQEKRNYYLFDTLNYSTILIPDVLDDEMHLMHFTYYDNTTLYAINRYRSDYSELFKFDIQTGHAELNSLKDFKYLILDMYAIPEGGYCLFIQVNRKSYMLSFFD